MVRERKRDEVGEGVGGLRDVSSELVVGLRGVRQSVGGLQSSEERVLTSHQSRVAVTGPQKWFSQICWVLEFSADMVEGREQGGSGGALGALGMGAFLNLPPVINAEAAVFAPKPRSGRRRTSVNSESHRCFFRRRRRGLQRRSRGGRGSFNGFPANCLVPIRVRRPEARALATQQLVANFSWNLSSMAQW